MSTAAFFGVSAGKQFLRSSFLPAELADKLIAFPDLGPLPVTTSFWQCNVFAKRSSNCRTENGTTRKMSRQYLNAFREDIDGFSISPTSEESNTSSAVIDKNHSFEPEVERSLEAPILLQKSILEKQWYLSLDHTKFCSLNVSERTEVVRSGNLSARQRRLEGRRKPSTQNCVEQELTFQTGVKSKQNMSVRVKSLRNSMTDHRKGMLNQKLLTHEEVVHLSKKIRMGLNLEKHKSRLKVKLGYEPLNAQWAASMNMSTAELNRKLIDSFAAAEKLTMCNMGLVVSIARRYENMGVEREDLIQEGSIGLIRGIRKFDSSKGFKLSTYIYWWIRRGITRALSERSRIVRVPEYLQDRMRLIRKATLTLEANGVTPSLQNIARKLNISERKVENARKGKNKRILYLDKSFCGLENDACDTLHSFIADSNVENQPWFTVERDSLREDVNKLISSTLTKREQVIIRLYYGLDTVSRSYEDISKSVGLSREERRIRLISMEKLRHPIRRAKLEPIYTNPS